MDMTVNSTGALAHVTGVGYENSLRLKMSSSIRGLRVLYRIYIGDVGTTRSKVTFEL